MPVISENTINPELGQIFEEYGFQPLTTAVIAGNKTPDHLIEYKNIRIISETEIGDYKRKINEALNQLTIYNDILHFDNLLALIFPDSVRISIPFEKSKESIRDIFRRTKIYIYLQIKDKITRIYNKYTIFEFLDELKKIIEKTYKEPEIHLEAIVSSLRSAVEEFSYTLRERKLGDQLFQTPVGNFELFTAISEEKDKSKLETSLVDLISYIFINQILFYKIFTDKHKELPKLNSINNLSEIQIRYERIKQIDYKAIYEVDILSLLPGDKVIINTINNIIRLINNLPIEYVKHDILGRFFHDLLPPNTRKILAAFYTRPQSAEILATLSIDRPDEIVIDPACGSGTLLVSSYRRKEFLEGGINNEIHKRFVEKEIYGIDIMPFAVHLTALNLSLQNLNAVTNNTQTAIADSLLELKVGSENIKRVSIPSIFQMLKQKTIDSVDENKEIHIPHGYFDLVIMNPPFTKRERLPKNYSKEINSNWKQWGGGIGLWGPFIGLSYDYLVKIPGGKIAAVIPISIFRGEETRKLREKIFSNESLFRVRYVIKSLERFAFSESSAFRDILILFVADKNLSKTGFVFIKRDITKLSIDDAKNLGEKIRNIKEEIDYEDDDYFIYWIDWNDLVEDNKNLMHYFNVVKQDNRNTIYDFFDILKNNDLFKLSDENLISECWGPRPKGINNLLIITRPLDPSRIKRAFLILSEDDPKKKIIKVYIKGLNEIFEIPRNSVVYSLRTATGINKMILSENYMDYIIKEPYKELEQLKKLTNFKYDIDWEKINIELNKISTKGITTRRMRYDSNNTYLFSFCSEKQFFPTNQLKKINSDNFEIYSIFFNSIITLLQLFSKKEDTTENFVDIHGHDIGCLYLPSIDKLTDSQKNDIIQLLNELKDMEFPSLLQQLNYINDYRLKLDRTLFEILGINFDIKKLYRAVAEEIERNIGLK
jgi:hypothetical protein